jgi:energy-coupling factor transport system ATP-binding protein
MLSLRDVTVRFPDRADPVVDGFSISIPDGSLTWVRGGPDSGRTTLCLALAGLLGDAKPEALQGGQIDWQGQPITDHTVRRQLAVTLENPAAQLTGFKSTVADEIAFALEMRGVPADAMEEKIADAAGALGVSHLLQRDPRTLSGGETQRVVLAGCLVVDPRLWILDRPLTEIDFAGRQTVLRILQEMSGKTGATIVLADDDHDDIIRAATHVLDIDGGSYSANLQPDLPTTGMPLPTSLTIQKHPSASESAAPVLKVDDVSFRYDEGERMLIERQSLDLRPGECAWVTGPNGSGKTTLARLIVGLLRPTAGRVELSGENPAEIPLWRTARHVAYALQNADLQMVSTRVSDEVAFGLRAIGAPEDQVEASVDSALETLGLASVRDAHPHDLSRRLRKRISLASAFVRATPALILDEPSQLQTPADKRAIIELIGAALRTGRAVLCISNDLEFVSEALTFL